MTRWCFDTHAFYFWATDTVFQAATQADLDRRVAAGQLWVSAVCFWELALLVKKGTIEMPDVATWKQHVCLSSGIEVLDPSADDMIASTLLPDLHKDPFDRLLVAQARRHQSVLVTRDGVISQYDVETTWPSSGHC